MDTPSMDTPSDAGVNAPEGAGAVPVATMAEMQRIVQDMYLRMQRAEAELDTTRTALYAMEAERSQATGASSEVPMSVLMKTLIDTMSATSRSGADSGVAGPRDWKPPTWDGRADTFRDYILRLKSSYFVRSATKPTLSSEYYWDTVYNTLPGRERARMRHFWEKGSPTKGKDPEAFFAQLEIVFADSNEQAKALEQLTHLRHSSGQPWHEHQLEFDGLLMSADGESWSDATKIGYLKNTFSNAAKKYTAAMPRATDYWLFAEEVERIMTNLEMTDEFKAANKRWLREKGRESGPNTTVITQSNAPTTVARVDADGDTVMAPTRPAASRSRSRGDRKGQDGKQRAKWVDAAEREKRREKQLCFRCGSSGHRIKECPFAPAARPTTINATSTKPVLEADDDDSESDDYESGKGVLPLKVRSRE